jgi:hypothetical protein
MRAGQAIILPLCLLAVSICSFASAAQEATGYWNKLPLPTVEDKQQTNIEYAAVEKGGTVWICIRNIVYYWNGTKFVQPSTDQKENSGRVIGFVGGYDRVLYAVVVNSEKMKARLLKLSDGSAKYSLECYADQNYSAIQVYVSRSGKLYNWGGKFLAVYTSGAWNRIEINLSTNKTLIFETDGNVYFYYSGTLCSADKNDKLTSKDIIVPFVKKTDFEQISGSILGADSAIIVSQNEKGIHAFKLSTGEKVTLTDAIYSKLANMMFSNIFPLNDGSVVLSDGVYASLTKNLYVIKPDGTLTEIDVTKTAPDLPTAMRNQKNILSSKDDSIWIGMNIGGIAQVKNGEVILHNWKNGAPQDGVYALMSASDGSLYARTGNNLFKYDPDSKTPRSDEWTEYSAIDERYFRDFSGNMWMMLVDHPMEISRWDGHKWDRFLLPMNAQQISYIIYDNRGHLLFVPETPERPCCDLFGSTKTEYATVEDALIAAVADGAKNFGTTLKNGVCVAKDNRIIFRNGNRNEVKIWDGKHWGMLPLSQWETVVMDTTKSLFLTRDSNSDNSFLRYDRGQLVDIEPAEKESPIMLLGINGMQPYEEELLRSKPNQYIRVRKAPDNVIWTQKQRNWSKRPVDRNMIPIRNGIIPLTEGIWGGLWLGSRSGGPPVFCMSGEVIGCDLAGTPVENLQSGYLKFYDDYQGNLFIDAGFYRGYRHIFMRKNPQYQLVFVTPQKRAGNTVQLKMAPNSLVPWGAKIFWKVDNGEWNLAAKDRIEVRFSSSGKHGVNVIAIDPTGCAVCAATPLTITSEIGYPKTKMAGQGPFVIDQPQWKLPVTGAASAEGGSVEFVYRINGGDWDKATESGDANISGIKPGLHKMEISALEGDLVDPNPVILEFTYKPDLEQIARRIIALLSEQGVQSRAEAVAEIKAASPEILPILRKQIDSIRTQANSLFIIENIISQMERQ